MDQDSLWGPRLEWSSKWFKLLRMYLSGISMDHHAKWLELWVQRSSWSLLLFTRTLSDLCTTYSSCAKLTSGKITLSKNSFQPTPTSELSHNQCSKLAELISLGLELSRSTLSSKRTQSLISNPSTGLWVDFLKLRDLSTVQWAPCSASEEQSMMLWLRPAFTLDSIFQEQMLRSSPASGSIK